MTRTSRAVDPNDETHRPWWDTMVGPGKAFDTERYFVICSNCIGGCKGSTGPGSINPATGKPYALDFPMLTIADMVRAQKELIDHLGIEQLLCVVGGSMGGMQVLQWAVSYPEMVRLAIPIATTARLSPQAIAFDAVGRHAIMGDPDWNDGDYYGAAGPGARAGHGASDRPHHLSVRQVRCTPSSGAICRTRCEPDYDFVTEFKVESYLSYRGETFVKRFDANSYLYITKAMDYFDLAQPSGESAQGAIGGQGRVPGDLVLLGLARSLVYVQGDRLGAAPQQRRTSVYAEIQSDYGHDAFLLEVETLSRLITNFLEYAPPPHPELVEGAEPVRGSADD